MVRKLLTVGALALVVFAIGWAPRLRCIVEGVAIDTPFGPRPIEELKVGDVVWSRDAYGELSTSTVSAVRRSHVLRYLRFRIDDGSELAVTASHPLFVDGAWVQAGRVEQSDTLVGRSGPLALTRVDSRLGWTAVYDISVEPHESFFANGILVHKKSPDRSQSQAIGDTRTVVSALKTYASSNCGFFPADLTRATRQDGRSLL